MLKVLKIYFLIKKCKILSNKNIRIILEFIKMIKIENLEVEVASKTDENKKILNWISLNLEIWKNYCLLWKNWSGKSTLSSVLMWSPKYNVVWGEISLTSPQPSPLEEKEQVENLIDLSPEERSKAWIFLSFQNVPEIAWIKLIEYLRIIYNISKTSVLPSSPHPVTPSLAGGGTWLSPFVFKRFLKKYILELNIDEKLLVRDLNVGFSWWEKRKIEILQMKLINPKYIILDEIDSGLDLDAFKFVANELKKISSEENTLIIITHYFKILDYIDVDKVYVLKEWKVEKSWGKELIEEIMENGFE